MLSEYFRKNGYFTAGVGKIYHTDVGFEDPQSWDVEIREFGKRPPIDQIVKSGSPDGPGEHTTDWAWLKTRDNETPDGVVARKAAELMKQAVRSQKPFFLGVGFRRPHAPFGAPQKYFELYPLDTIQLPAAPPTGHFANLLPGAHPLRHRKSRFRSGSSASSSRLITPATPSLTHKWKCCGRLWMT